MSGAEDHHVVATAVSLICHVEAVVFFRFKWIVSYLLFPFVLNFHGSATLKVKFYVIYFTSTGKQ